MVQEYKISDAAWLKESSDLALAILSTPTRIADTWTEDTLKAELARIGVHYTAEEIALIAGELEGRGDLVKTDSRRP